MTSIKAMQCYRQFFQLGVETLGATGPDSDAEHILMQHQCWQALGLSEHLHLQLNTLGTPACRQAHRDALMHYLTQHHDQLDEDAQRRAANANARTDDLFGVSQDFADQRLTDRDREKPKEDNNEYYNYKIPWNLRLAYAANYTNTRREDRISSNSLMFSGDVELSPRWSVGVSSGYDFLNQGFTFTQLRFERDLLSWRMNFTWIPFGNQQSWNFFIGIKSNLLKDLKYDQRRQPDRQLGN